MVSNSKSKSRLWFKLLIFLFFILIVLSYWYYRQYILEKKSEQTFYKAFGISIPNNYAIHGIDVSKYQSYIYWKSVKKMNINNITIDFAFIKATEGLYSTDAMFNRNWKLSKENKVTRGAYHYFVANKNGKAQANHFLNVVQFMQGDLPPVVDIEDDMNVSKKVLLARLKEFVGEVEMQTGIKPIIYSYLNFYNNFLKDDFKDFPLWVAHYNEDNAPAMDEIGRAHV